MKKNSEKTRFFSLFFGKKNHTRVNKCSRIYGTPLKGVMTASDKKWNYLGNFYIGRWIFFVKTFSRFWVKWGFRFSKNRLNCPFWPVFHRKAAIYMRVSRPETCESALERFNSLVFGKTFRVFCNCFCAKFPLVLR